MFTFAVITCNRVHYLKNCVNSILEFVGLDDIDLMILDNRTSEEGIEAYLSSLPSSIHVKRFNDQSPHELHRAMNYAIQWSRDKGNKYCNFIQDDYQYLYSQPDLLNRVEEAFDEYSDVMQVHTNLVWKAKHKNIGRVKIRKTKSASWFWPTEKPPCDNGFTRVSMYDRIGLYPSHTSIHGKEKGYVSGETWLAGQAEKHGYQRFIATEPNQAMIFDCAFVRGNKREGRYFAPPNKYYLKPFDESKIKQIHDSSQQERWSFIEDCVESDGWIPETTGKHSKNNAVEKL
jgi:glycosyltransferase involved in cell wall biosynthesis